MKKITRRESLLTLGSALAAGGVTAQAALQAVSGSGEKATGTPAPAAGGNAQNQPIAPSPADKSFQAFVKRYFDGFFQFNPVQAARAGIHKYDAELPAYSNTDIQAEIARNRTRPHRTGQNTRRQPPAPKSI